MRIDGTLGNEVHGPKRVKISYWPESLVINLMAFMSTWAPTTPNVFPVPTISTDGAGEVSTLMRCQAACSPLDINIELGIGSQPGKLSFYMFNEPALNGFAKDLADSRDQSDTPYKIIGTQSIDIRPLSQILDENLPTERTIDFMSVDVEGLDLDVLRSSNWVKYRPRYLLVEILDSSMNDIENHLVSKFMSGVGYRVYAKCVHTVIFKNMDA